ncbi:dapper homolog 2 [Astyanax mexicanus]|uniref:dapper homolog 2 n=1 Tax=Astyanax mexicanus TaxID=7994 RepID=UPI0020CB48A3|nr:dapper homolog 2 [Astyanax mexicanus]
MLNRKVAGAELLSAAAGVDRGRVGERLQAALAGLQELHHLREKQSDMVRWALRLDREQPASSPAVNPRDSDSSSEEQRLEATLTALKQQLTRLRRQDVGLKTHLQQLDQQISELKLDVCKASAEHLESDSRPSSGFYELSDGGLGSLSNSCTSLYSECLSSSSQASLLPLSSLPSAPHAVLLPAQAEVSRRRSADESTAQPDAPRGPGVRLGSSGIRTTSVSSERARQRPVSTGDLDRVINPGFGYCKPVDMKTSAVCRNLCNPTLDTKFQSNLVSRNGMEVYRYPSPLHAVALQSPIFSLSGDQETPVGSEAQENPVEVGLMEDTLSKQDLSASRPVGYIVKLVQRSSGKMNLQRELSTEKLYTSCSDTQGPGLIGSRAQVGNYGPVTVAEVQGGLQQKTLYLENPVDSGKYSPARTSGQEQMISCPQMISDGFEESKPVCQFRCPTGAMNHRPGVLMGPTFKVREKTEDQKQSTLFHHNKNNKDDFKATATVSKPSESRLSLISSSNDENRSSDGSHQRTGQSEFVHAQFVPAGSQRVKVHQEEKKTKAVKLRKRGNEKPPGKKHQQRHSLRELEKDRGCHVKIRGETRDTKQISGRLREARVRSCSESSLLGPGNPCASSSTTTNAHLQSSQPQQRSSKPRKTSQVPDLGNSSSVCQSRRKPNSRKWPSASEIQLPPHPLQTHHQRSREAPTHRLAGLCPQKPGMRPHSGHWGGVPHPIQPPFSSSSSSYFNNMNLRYPPAPACTRYPPRCESEFSEYSAECASLFHSTIAESSEGELSDFTANRFGDSESSQGSRTASDSDSSLSLDEEDILEEEEDEGDLVWAEAAVGPTAAGLSLQNQHPPRPEPVACRIKASRALKKKIRRFQPASLKVMTLV